MLVALKKEIVLRKDYLQDQQIETIYFGGGTPSLLDVSEIESLLETITKNFKVNPEAEITIEANPDDLTLSKVNELHLTPINRFSIGTQSFFDDDLIWMNRVHRAEEAESAIKRVQDAGFENITIDLIYGFPLLSDLKWLSNIDKALVLGVPHISSYSITTEPKTALADFIKKGKQLPMSDLQSASQFEILMQKLSHSGFEHYEISNFARPGRYSKHNSSYWKGVSYLGIGPSAHSFNQLSRQWNVANNARYIDQLNQDIIPAETEILSKKDRLNEYIMTSLRTIWGLDLHKIETDFGPELKLQTERSVQKFLHKDQLTDNNGVITLTQEGKLFADYIASQLFADEDFN